MAETTFLVVGLGNPGPTYAGNRHNAGFMTVDELARRAQVTFQSHRSNALVAAARLGFGPGGVPGPRVLLAKPMGFMNTSGGPVSALLSYFGVEVARLIVVHDEMDLAFGDVRLKGQGGEGGHNGLRDISKALGQREYTRVRIGVGRPPGRMDPAAWVLKDFSPAERRELPLVIATAADAVEVAILEGLEAAQLRFHTKA